MTDILEKYLSDTEWLLSEQEYGSGNQSLIETLFALGNGYVASRGILEERPKEATPGTFFSGLYDITGAEVEELVNAPEPFHLKIIAPEGEKLGRSTMKIIRHERMLDMHNGLLTRKTLYSSVKNGKFNYKSLRFISMANPNLAVMRVWLKPLDKNTEFTIQSYVDTSIINMGLVTEGDKCHFNIAEVTKVNNCNYLSVKTQERSSILSYATKVIVEKNQKSSVQSHRTFKIALKKNESVCITKYISLFNAGAVSQDKLKSKTMEVLIKESNKGFDKLIAEHSVKWNRLWQLSDVKIQGDPALQKAVRFNIYHLFVSAPHKDLNVSVGARGLVGEGYRGHIFWDTELFVLPFYIYTKPEIAKYLLLYRYRRLKEAKVKAAENGYKGAMFPWESASMGNEVTPSWYKDSAGNVGEVLTGKMEHHITADIAYGVCNYFQVTDDVEFMYKYGLEIVVECARFWASRVKLKGKKYVINMVIPPDEFREGINNNAYTNYMASWNLSAAVLMIETIRQRDKSKINALLNRLDITPGEIKKWQHIARSIYIPRTNKNGVIEAFDGYFKARDIKIEETDHNYLPVLPDNIDMKNISKTQLLKQADLIMLLHLFPEMLPPKQIKTNFDYYEKRTTHLSSLSAAIHASMAAKLGYINMAYKYFMIAANADLKNVYKNAYHGIHSASLGGAWQSVFCGFAGISVDSEGFRVYPNLPQSWEKLSLTFLFKSRRVNLELTHDSVKIYLNSKKNRELMKVTVFDKVHKLTCNKWHVILRKK